MNWFLAKAYLKHVFKKKHWKSSDFQSQQSKELAQFIIYEELPYYGYSEIHQIRNSLLQSKKKISITDLGAGSKKFKSNQRSIKDLIKYNSSSVEQGELIYRLVSYFKPKNIIELGTSLGIGTLYLAFPNSQSNVITIEGCPNISDEARNNFKTAGVRNIIQHTGSFSKVLPSIINDLDSIDMVYFDGHHAYKATMDYFKQCISKASVSSIFIFDDIYWSVGMAKAWEEIKQHPAISISFDLFRYGVVILKVPELNEHYVIKKM